ncbi:MAG: ACT domain-containing protein [Candidatus Micrarchaeota archaeon]|nr:ACT domain-containing protein [Candidatus Micrarchaeota archaeon]
MKQITIIANDRIGLLADISYILGKAKINIEAISVQTQGKKGIINLTVKDDQKAIKMLSSNGFQVFPAEILVVRLKDEPGQMAQMTKILKENKINIESLYIIAKDEQGYAIHALKVDKLKKAKKLLSGFLISAQ